MSLITTHRFFPAKVPSPKYVLLLCGFGGAVWQTRRLIRTLHKAGYSVTALDFSKQVLSSGDPQLLINLAQEVTTVAENEAKKTGQAPLLIGISLGALLSLNILRRSSSYSKAVMITGGNIVTVAKNIYGGTIWPQSHTELSSIWESVNMFSDPAEWQGKRAIFVLPLKDKLIDTQEVLAEIQKQKQAGNNILLVQRQAFGHVGTIIEETILFPHRILTYIKKVEQA